MAFTLRLTVSLNSASSGRTGSACAVRHTPSAVFTCIGALGTPSRTGPLARKYLPGFPYSYFTAASWGPLKKKKKSGGLGHVPSVPIG